MEDSVFQPGFNRSIRVEVSPTALTEDTGALLLREAAEDLGFDDIVGQCLDHRDANYILHPMTELFRTRVFLLAQGYRDQDDADALRDDPAFRLAVSDRKSDRALLSAGTCSPRRGCEAVLGCGTGRRWSTRRRRRAATQSWLSCPAVGCSASIFA